MRYRGPMSTFGTKSKPLDLLIVGAGLAGIGLAHHVHQRLPRWHWEILEEKEDLGGTWRTFRYPGIRSDSDMATYAYPFAPWRDRRALLDGSSILEYLRRVAERDGTVRHIRYGQRVVEANWIAEDALWELQIHAAHGGRFTRYAKRVHWATGYFTHEHGYQPVFPGEDCFQGRIIHPQQWPKDAELLGKRVVVIGSGATAITLVPSLVERGAEVVMLQRTPSWIAPLPNTDRIGMAWRGALPFAPRWAAAATLATHSVRDTAQVVLAKLAPRFFGAALHHLQRKFVSEEEIKRNFTPTYNPWTQRVCKSPDGDFFRAIGNGATVVTDRVEEFTEAGVRTAQHGVLEADIIVPATGLELQMLGGACLSLGGQPISISDRISYRGVMLDGVPNTSFSIGYFQASWTLRVDLVNRWLTGLWRDHPEVIVPTAPADVPQQDFITLKAGYVRRGVHRMPKQGSTLPWRFAQNYLVERAGFTGPGKYRDLRFGKEACAAVAAPAAQV